ncbi:endonuclease/exonuclease/phosphatase family protein [Kytococcus aerolatus]|uniref:endonuclease/exonuclease/phosphatase family protein n=1 Tax=Kytococcus aerolatus TaxID=592308 RepID=UPI00135C676D|nr:endonuclease/exonuclease/phosphatase family protein [Kytococcus aerolatus]
MAAVAATALSAPVTAAPTQHMGKAGDPERKLTVVSFNIHHGADRFDVLDLERIARDIDSFDADVIALQEVDNHWGERSEFVDQSAWLANRLGLHYCYAANLDEDPAGGRTERRQYGTAILSRYKLSDCENHMLPNHQGGEQRGVAEATVKVRGVPVTVMNTHLTHVDAEYRTKQFAVVNDLVAAQSNPTVVLGDLNAAPGSTEHEEYTRILTDVWPLVGEGDGLTYAPGNPLRRIDYVLASKEITPLRATVPLVYSSDHYPVVAELQLPHPREVHRGR